LFDCLLSLLLCSPSAHTHPILSGSSVFISVAALSRAPSSPSFLFPMLPCPGFYNHSTVMWDMLLSRGDLVKNEKCEGNLGKLQPKTISPHLPSREPPPTSYLHEPQRKCKSQHSQLSNVPVDDR
jgi:hypothetical protein